MQLPSFITSLSLDADLSPDSSVIVGLEKGVKRGSA